MRIEEYQAFKAALNRANSHLGLFKTSSIDGLVKYVERAHNFNASMNVNEVGALIDKVPVDKRAKYKDVVREVAKAVLMDTPAARSIINQLGAGGYAAMRAAVDDLLNPNATGAMGGLFDGTRRNDGSLLTSFTSAMQPCVASVTSELTRVQKISAHMTRLAGALDAGHLVLTDANTMPHTEYGYRDRDTTYVGAARWVVNASSTFRGQAPEKQSRTLLDLASVIKSAVNGDIAFNTPRGLLEFYAQIVGETVQGKTQRMMHPNPAVPTPSDKIGHALMLHWLEKVANVTGHDRNFLGVGMFMMGTIVGCHGFVDGNGRTARCCYAAGCIRGLNFFEGVTTEYDSLLNGLNGQSVT
jgi:hypothetical protein